MTFDIDTEISGRPLTSRERLSVWLLLVAFCFVAPAKYSHQLKEFIAELKANL